jgi:hypothetical protein
MRRNAATRGGKQEWRDGRPVEGSAGGQAPEEREALDNDRLRQYVQERLSGNVHRPDGTVVAGPQTPAWNGLNKPHRQDRRWAMAWSPEQISHRLSVGFPEDESMRISHEAIYQSLFIEGRGASLRRRSCDSVLLFLRVATTRWPRVFVLGIVDSSLAFADAAQIDNPTECTGFPEARRSGKQLCVVAASVCRPIRRPGGADTR